MNQAQGGGQRWTPQSYDAHARYVSDLAGEIVSWLAPMAGERILDLACGDGALTAELARSGAVLVGVDLSEELLQAARARGLDVRLLDGEKLDFEGEFDAVSSNAALHWMRNREAAIAGVYRALKPGGRLVAEFGGHGNVAAIVTAMLAVGERRGGNLDLAHPWFFPGPAVYRRVLERQGFGVRRIELAPRPTPIPTGMAEWLKLFRKPFFEQFETEEENALQDCVDLLRPSLCDDDGNWTADYVRLRVEARKP